MSDLSSTAIADFIDYLGSERGLSPLTLEAYGRDIRSFQQFVAERPWPEVKAEHILDFLEHLKRKNYAPSSICRMLISVKVFFRFLKKEGLIGIDLARY